MDIFLLLPSCGWCVTHFLSSFYSSFSFFFNFSGCNFKFSFSFSWVASLGIREILPLVINNFKSLGTQKDRPNAWRAYDLSCRQTGSNRKP